MNNSLTGPRGVFAGKRVASWYKPTIWKITGRLDNYWTATIKNTTTDNLEIDCLYSNILGHNFLTESIFRDKKIFPNCLHA